MKNIMYTTFLFYIFGLNPILSTDNTVNSDPIFIQNKFVTCYTDRIVIHWYYFPFGDKTIKYNDIRSCELLKNDQLGFLDTKCWGMALAPIWWHADFRRGSREYFIILDANQWPKIGLTMDDNDTLKVYKLLKERVENEPDVDNVKQSKNSSGSKSDKTL